MAKKFFVISLWCWLIGVGYFLVSKNTIVRFALKSFYDTYGEQATELLLYTYVGWTFVVSWAAIKRIMNGRSNVSEKNPKGP